MQHAFLSKSLVSKKGHQISAWIQYINLLP